jgi:hypothetical protein
MLSICCLNNGYELINYEYQTHFFSVQVLEYIHIYIYIYIYIKYIYIYSYVRKMDGCRTVCRLKNTGTPSVTIRNILHDHRFCRSLRPSH